MRTRRNFLIAMDLVLFLVGTIGSVGVARESARADSKTSHQEFVATAANIASTLKLALQHEQDLTISAGASSREIPMPPNPPSRHRRGQCGRLPATPNC